MQNYTLLAGVLRTNKGEKRRFAQKRKSYSAAKHLGAQERCILEALGKRPAAPRAAGPMGGLGKGPNGEDEGGGRRDDAAPHKKERGPRGPLEARKGPSGPSPARALPPMGADAPCASAASRPPADRIRSTLGDGGLSCRVRDGIGRSPPPWPRSRRAPPALSVRHLAGALAAA